MGSGQVGKDEEFKKPKIRDEKAQQQLAGGTVKIDARKTNASMRRYQPPAAWGSAIVTTEPEKGQGKVGRTYVFVQDANELQSPQAKAATPKKSFRSCSRRYIWRHGDRMEMYRFNVKILLHFERPKFEN